MGKSVKIAFLGATSQIAKDLLWSFSFSNTREFEFILYSRNSASVKRYIQEIGFKNKVRVLDYSDFSTKERFDWIINFVGIGDPKKIANAEFEILRITEHFDAISLRYLEKNSECGYIFLSSGAVFGGNFDCSVKKNTKSVFSVNELGETDWYGIAKFYAESKHRALEKLNIVDIRIFSYFSRFTSLESRFIITDMINCIKNNTLFITTKDDIYRDYFTPFQFYELINAIFQHKGNYSVDCYTLKPLGKIDLINQFQNNFGLAVEYKDVCDFVQSTGYKKNYYSESMNAEKIGYYPKKSSLDAVIEEVEIAVRLIKP